jgi:S1-C subfamily serine protease
MFSSRAYILSVRLALAILLLCVSALGQEAVKSPGKPAPGEAAQSFPWLVTVVHELKLKDFITDLQAQGLRISTLDDLPLEEESITNIASGIVIGQRGRILVRLTTRLANFSVKPRVNCVTIITSDGRKFRPRSIKTDEATGYAVIDVPDLKVEPPPIAPILTMSGAWENARLIYQVPDWLSVSTAEQSAPREQVEKMAAQTMQQLAELPMKLRVVEDSVRIAIDKSKEVANEAVVAALEARRRDIPTGSGFLLNEKGEVIGFTEILGPGKGIVRSIEQISRLAEQVAARELGRAQGWLGLRLEEQFSQAEVKRRLPPSSKAKASLLVTEAIPASPAARAGVKTGDYIVRFNGEFVHSFKDLTDRLAAVPVGKEVPLEILRNGALQQVMVVVEPRPETLRLAASEDRKRRELSVRSPNEAGSRVRRPSGWQRIEQLGMRVAPLNEHLREAFGVQEPGGVLVRQVSTVGPAGRGGLRAGDVIVKINDVSVTSYNDLLTAMNRTSSGQLTLSVIRKKQPMLITISVDSGQ